MLSGKDKRKLNRSYALRQSLGRTPNKKYPNDVKGFQPTKVTPIGSEIPITIRPKHNIFRNGLFSCNNKR